MEIYGYRTGAVADFLDHYLDITEYLKRNTEVFERELAARAAAGKGDATTLEKTLLASNRAMEGVLALANAMVGAGNPANTIRGAADYFRIGEGFQKGGWGYVEDTLRIVGLVTSPGAARGLHGIKRAASAVGVAGGPMSCAFTSTMKALNLSGRLFFTPLTALGRRLKMVKLPASGTSLTKFAAVVAESDFVHTAESAVTQEKVISKTFGGNALNSLVDDILRPLKIFRPGDLVKLKLKSLSDAVENISKHNGVMLIHYSWELTPKISGKHVIAVHKYKGVIHFADQHGTFQSLEKLAAENARAYLRAVEKAKNAGRFLEEQMLQEAKALDAATNPLAFFNDCVKVHEAVVIKNSFFAQFHDLPVALVALNPNNILNHIVTPIFELEMDSLLSLYKKFKELEAGAIKKHKIPAKYPLKNSDGLTQKAVGDPELGFRTVKEYATAQGDTLEKIAVKFYGAAAAVDQIKAGNWDLKHMKKDAPLAAGSKIIIP